MNNAIVIHSLLQSSYVIHMWRLVIWYMMQGKIIVLIHQIINCHIECHVKRLLQWATINSIITLSANFNPNYTLIINFDRDSTWIWIVKIGPYLIIFIYHEVNCLLGLSLIQCLFGKPTQQCYSETYKNNIQALIIMQSSNRFKFVRAL